MTYDTPREPRRNNPSPHPTPAGAQQYVAANHRGGHHRGAHCHDVPADDHRPCRRHNQHWAVGADRWFRHPRRRLSHGPRRRPSRKRGGEWRRTSWNEDMAQEPSGETRPTAAPGRSSMMALVLVACIAIALIGLLSPRWRDVREEPVGYVC